MPALTSRDRDIAKTAKQSDGNYIVDEHNRDDLLRLVCIWIDQFAAPLDQWQGDGVTEPGSDDPGIRRWFWDVNKNICQLEKAVNELQAKAPKAWKVNRTDFDEGECANKFPCEDHSPGVPPKPPKWPPE